MIADRKPTKSIISVISRLSKKKLILEPKKKEKVKEKYQVYSFTRCLTLNLFLMTLLHL
jgi:hypothetical protein